MRVGELIRRLKNFSGFMAVYTGMWVVENSYRDTVVERDRQHYASAKPGEREAIKRKASESPDIILVNGMPIYSLYRAQRLRAMAEVDAAENVSTSEGP